MASERFFFSPSPTIKTVNQYTLNFYTALSDSVNVVNDEKPLSRSSDFFKYSFSSDIMVLNWPEDVLFLRLGLFQLFVSFASLTFFKMRGGKIIWVCHNKTSHTKTHKFLQKITRKFFTAMSDHIIVHSQDALNYFKQAAEKVVFLNHPVYPKKQFSAQLPHIEPDIDVLIWGTISPYKGLVEFISNYRLGGASFNLTIIGKAEKSYFMQLKRAAEGLNIHVEDKVLSDEELDEYFRRSKIVLLPYLDTDTFSSGALIHSLNSEKVVIGPSIGNFIDIHRYGACMMYSDFPELLLIVNRLLNDKEYYSDQLTSLKKGILNYYNENSWHQFVNRVLQSIHQKQFNKPSVQA